MKMILVLMTLLTSSAFASNPLIRTCNVTGGEFHVVIVNGQAHGICRFGKAAIDALSLLEATSSERVSESVMSFEKTAGGSCEDFQGVVLEIHDLDGKPFDICRFYDRSFIEVNTLEKGPQSPDNQALLQAVQTRF